MTTGSLNYQCCPGPNDMKNPTGKPCDVLTQSRIQGLHHGVGAGGRGLQIGPFAGFLWTCAHPANIP